MNRQIIYLLLASTLLATFAGAPTLAADVRKESAPDPQQSPQRLTSSERRAIKKLVAKFRRARRDLEAQAAILIEATQTSPYAVENIRTLIEAQLTPAVTRYRRDFLRAAAGAAQERFALADKEEFAILQAQVNALREDPNLTKEQVKRVGDPAMKRLAEIALVDRNEILASNRKLVEQRQKLLPAGKLWEVANEYLHRVSAWEQNGEPPSKATTFEEFLVQEEEIAVRLALPMNDEYRAVLQANERLARQLDPEESKCVLSLNLTRILLGLQPLLIDLRLTEAARDHSHDMREHKFFSHTSPLPGKKTFGDRAARFGAKASGENIAVGYPTGPAVNLGWFHSPGHHKNMLGSHKTVGVGREGKHWTELFGRG